MAWFKKGKEESEESAKLTPEEEFADPEQILAEKREAAKKEAAGIKVVHGLREDPPPAPLSQEQLDEREAARKQRNRSKNWKRARYLAGAVLLIGGPAYCFRDTLSTTYHNWRSKPTVTPPSPAVKAPSPSPALPAEKADQHIPAAPSKTYTATAQGDCTTLYGRWVVGPVVSTSIDTSILIGSPTQYIRVNTGTQSIDVVNPKPFKVQNGQKLEAIMQTYVRGTTNNGVCEIIENAPTLGVTNGQYAQMVGGTLRTTTDANKRIAAGVVKNEIRIYEREK